MVDNVGAILRLWYLIEILSPQAIKFRDGDEEDEKASEFRIKPDGMLPWSELDERQQRLLEVPPQEPDDLLEDDEQELNDLVRPDRASAAFLIYLGVSKITQFDQAIVRAAGTERTDLDRERASKELCAFATIQLTAEGRYVAESFTVSTLPWGLQKLRAMGVEGFVKEPKQKEFDEFAEGLEKQLPISRSDPLTANEIISAAEFVRDACGLRDAIPFETPARGVLYQLGLKEPGDLLNSFYYKDLVEAMSLYESNSFPGILRRIFSRPDTADRVEVLHDARALRTIVAPSRYPRAAWPNVGIKPALMQQAAVILANQLTDSVPLLAVNGPPGTGKTTMVRSFLADLLVKRARQMCDAEVTWQRITDEDDENRYYFRPPDSVTGFEVVVASSNNGAIENISDELPDAVSVQGFNEHLQLESNDYFLPVGKNVAHYRNLKKGRDVWGLIAASLGNKSKRTAFIEPFLYNYKYNPKRKRPIGHITISEYIKNRQSLNWNQVKSEFLEALQRYERSLEMAQDDAFWSDDLTERHDQVPLLDQEMLTASQELFTKALRVHRSFIEKHWRSVQHNLHLWAKVARRPDLFPDDMAAALWQTLFLIVPVVSTTFASASRMLSRFKGIGWAIIDEAGQATPQASVGLFTRARRALVIGDPLQLEPVVTLSSAIIKAFRNVLKVDAKWVSANDTSTSLQTVVERVMPWGSNRSIKGAEPQWIGVPLVVHRRCLEPMFSVANEIVYGGDMIFRTKPLSDSDLYPFGESAWIDERSPCSGRHAVDEQVQLALTIVQAMQSHYALMTQKIIREKHGLVSAAEMAHLREPYAEPDIRIVTPFREIEGRFNEAAREMGNQRLRGWCEERVGTVHKAQGKEAGLVICVLGLDPKKSGAAEFATLKPNFLNVAITRAKHRLYVIGNVGVWAYKDYFRDLYGAFTKRDAVITPQAFLERYSGLTMEAPRDARISLLPGDGLTEAM